jgi:hypothetical protein
MKRFVFAALPVLFLASLFTEAQGSAPLNDTTRPATTKGVNISGKLSGDGKVLVTDDDNNWSVTNPDALKGFEGQYLTVRCRMEPAKRAIRVLSVVEQLDEKHAARLGDPAFRR